MKHEVDLVLELELAQADLVQLNRRVDLVETSMKALDTSINDMVITLKRIIGKDS